jgi:hypothetical protein
MSTSTDLLTTLADAEAPHHEVEIAVRHRRGSQFDVYLTVDEVEFNLGTVERVGRFYTAKDCDLRIQGSGRMTAYQGIESLVRYFAIDHLDLPSASVLLALAGQVVSVPNDHGLVFSNELGFVSIPGRD